MPTINYFSFLLFVVLVSASACKTVSDGSSELYLVADVDSALSTTLVPSQTADYYIEQGVKYFLTMESSVPIKVKPYYSDLVIRWEWHPWLLLTGYRRRNLIDTDILLKLYPTKYDTIDCRFFEQQPFCRCHVVFNYSGKRVPIYEEFTFNNEGEITFIEAWSDFPSLLPMDKTDYWAEAEDVNRLSTRVPGLGNNEGRIDPKATWMLNAAKTDTVLADMLHRLHRPFNTYMKELRLQGKAMKQAHEPPEGDVYPYYP
ncbi:MAG: hypothetical protein K9J17_02680 [Flavobacteriales bacterium]|nr:hypothetical protein [Flavobacteriales bacterium]